MIYIKSFLAGLGALIVVVATIIGLAIAAPFVVEKMRSPSGGGVGWVMEGPFVSIWLLLAVAALLAAAISFWTFKRLSKTSGDRS